MLRPNRKDFSQPFLKYISQVLSDHPGTAVVKVIPPKGWSPRRHAYPPLEDVTIGVPIKQHVRAPTEQGANFLRMRPCSFFGSAWGRRVRSAVTDAWGVDAGAWQQRRLSLLL